MGMNKTILFVALILTMTSLLVANIWAYNPLLYMFSVVMGGITGGTILTTLSSSANHDLIAQLETNYYTIRVGYEKDYKDELTGRRTLNLDLLLHSTVDTENPFFLHYTHEHIQMEFLRGARQENPTPRVLVVGGGGYTFPRYAMEVMAEARMDVVEIDPGVTWMAKNHLGLKDYNGLKIHHMDGRQYVAEKVPPGTYDLVVQDAVNDLSVPAHLLTKEYNDAVKAALKPNGVYLLTVIDSIGYGKLWKAAMHTLQQTYPAENIALLLPEQINSGRMNFTDYTSYLLFWRQQVPENVLMRINYLKNRRITRTDFLNELSDVLEPNEYKQYVKYILEAVDPVRYKLTDPVFTTLRSLKVPETVLTKLNPSLNKSFSWESFEERLTAVLDPNESARFTNVIMDNAVDLSDRQVYVIYASDRPLNLTALRAAVSSQVVPGFSAASTIGGVASGMQASGGIPIPNVLAATALQPSINKEELEGIFMTNRVPQALLQPYLDTPPRIILTDQFAPVDNLMADVFRYRYRNRPK
jgi:spermidine synthase